MKNSTKALPGNLLAILALALLVVIPVSEIMAQEEPATPGIIFGTGTSFAVTDSDYLNVTLTSAAEVEVMINSSPMIIHISVAAAAGDTSTDITLGGLEADTTYWLYQDADIDGVQFSTDANGNHSLTVDLSEFHDFRIQPERSTVYINNGGYQCTSVGTWDNTTKTCTLTQDVNDSIYIYTSGVTLDGAGHTVNLPYWGSVQMYGSGHTVKNVTIQGRVWEPYGCTGSVCQPTGTGFYLYEVDHSTIQNVTVNGTYYGIRLWRSSYNDVSGNSFNGVGYGAYIDGNHFYGQSACDTYQDYHCGSSYNTLSDNVFSSYSAHYDFLGIYLSHASRNNVIRGNMLSDFNYGLLLADYYCTSSSHYGCSAANSIYQNSFSDSDYHHIWTHRGGLAGTTFNQPAPDGGNYYSDFDEPGEGCNDSNTDRFCDVERPVYIYYGGYGHYGADYLPWTTQGGWNNAAPVPDAGGPYSGNEGSAISISASATDADGDPLTFAWSVDGSGCSFANASAATTAVTCDDNSSHTLTVTVSDGTASASDTASLTVNNVAPTVTITAPTDGAITPVHESIQVTATISDPSSADTHTCSVSFGDGNSQSPGCSVAGGVTSSLYPYAEAGVYEVSVTATDDDGGETTATVMNVVYDPSAGFVTGGGWIDSPAGAYAADPALAGKANFGFVSKYKKGATRPTGETQFVFKAGDLSFHSETYQWLVVNQGGANAQYKGTGTIDGALDPNGMPYGFMLWGNDGDNVDPVSADTFRIRIWSETPAGEVVVYDNGFDQPISGGAIVVHTGGKGGKK